MGTTDPKLALTALEILTEAGVGYAMLHSREELLKGEVVSDVDLVVDRDPDEIIAATRAAFASQGLFPVVVTRYDLAGTRGVWYALEDASEAVQLDFLHDIEGLGSQGLRSSGLLAFALRDRFPPLIGAEAELVYLWRKRVWKRQLARLDELRTAAMSLPVARVIEASIAVTGSERTAREILGKRPLPAWIQTTSHPVLRVKRIGARIALPAGFWLHVSSRDLAAQVADTFHRILPHSRIGEVPRSRVARNRWFWGSVQPIRLRPGSYVSYGLEPDRPRPDLVAVEDTSVLEIRVACVAAMAARF